MKSFNHYFDAIYLINLDRRPDRLQAATKELEKFDIIAERFPAVDGKAMFPEIKYPFASELATAMSHIAVWKTAQKLNLKNVLILEDDVQFSDEIKLGYIREFMLELPVDWDLVYFGGNHVTQPENYGDHIARIFHTYALHCYAVNSTAYKKLIIQAEKETKQNLRNHKELKITCAIDVILAKMQPGLKCYCPDIKLAWQAPGFSDIQEAHVNYDEVLKK